jgi:hypothetical protein
LDYVRINTHLISSDTGKNLGDDYKKILFKDLSHAVGLGFMYQFDDNYWLTINSEKTKNLAASSTVKRCNNTLRWYDYATGALYSEPCNLDYEILRNVNNESPSSLIVTPSGRFEILVQFNDRTNLIRPNQRFLFGNEDNWTAYKIVGGGINNFQNIETLDNTTPGMLRLTVVVDYLSDNDDLTDGVAYENKQEYALTLGQTGISGILGATGIQIYPTVTLNGERVTRTVDWSSSNTGIAIIGATGIASGQTGVPSLLTLGRTGTAVVTGALSGNTGIHAHVNITVSSSSSNIYQVVIDPNKNYILEGKTQAYTVYLYTNGVKGSETFTFSVNAGTVPSDHYAFSYTATPGNAFSVENKEMFLTDHLTITCTSGSYTGSIEVNLRGVW